eukprot:jgi/Ulvmu1/5103/UM021_0120.1
MPKKQSLWERAVGDDYQSPGRRKKRTGAGRHASVVAQTRMEQLLEDLKLSNQMEAPQMTPQLGRMPDRSSLFPPAGRIALWSAATQVHQRRTTAIQMQPAQAGPDPGSANMPSANPSSGWSVTKVGVNHVRGSAGVPMPPLSVLQNDLDVDLKSCDMPSLLTSIVPPAVQMTEQPTQGICDRRWHKQPPQPPPQLQPAMYSQPAQVTPLLQPVMYSGPHLPVRQEPFRTEQEPAHQQRPLELVQQNQAILLQQPQVQVQPQLNRWQQASTDLHGQALAGQAPNVRHASVLQLIANARDRTTQHLQPPATDGGSAAVPFNSLHMPQARTGPVGIRLGQVGHTKGDVRAAEVPQSTSTTPAHPWGGQQRHKVAGLTAKREKVTLYSKGVQQGAAAPQDRLSAVRVLQSNRPKYLSAGGPAFLVPVRKTGILHAAQDPQASAPGDPGQGLAHESHRTASIQDDCRATAVSAGDADGKMADLAALARVLIRQPECDVPPQSAQEMHPSGLQHDSGGDAAFVAGPSDVEAGQGGIGDVPLRLTTGAMSGVGLQQCTRQTLMETISPSAAQPHTGCAGNVEGSSARGDAISDAVDACMPSASANGAAGLSGPETEADVPGSLTTHEPALANDSVYVSSPTELHFGRVELQSAFDGEEAVWGSPGCLDACIRARCEAMVEGLTGRGSLYARADVIHSGEAQILLEATFSHATGGNVCPGSYRPAHLHESVHGSPEDAGSGAVAMETDVLGTGTNCPAAASGPDETIGWVVAADSQTSTHMPPGNAIAVAPVCASESASVAKEAEVADSQNNLHDSAITEGTRRIASRQDVFALPRSVGDASVQTVPGPATVVVEVAVQVASEVRAAGSQSCDLVGGDEVKSTAVVDRSTSWTSMDRPGGGVYTSNTQTQTGLIHNSELMACHDDPGVATCDAHKRLTYNAPKLLTYPQPLLLTYPSLGSVDVSETLAGDAVNSTEAEPEGGRIGHKSVCASHADLDRSVITVYSTQQQPSFSSETNHLKREIASALERCSQQLDTIAFLQSRTCPLVHTVGRVPTSLQPRPALLDSTCEQSHFQVSDAKWRHARQYIELHLTVADENGHNASATGLAVVIQLQVIQGQDIASGCHHLVQAGAKQVGGLQPCESMPHEASETEQHHVQSSHSMSMQNLIRTVDACSARSLWLLQSTVSAAGKGRNGYTAVHVLPSPATRLCEQRPKQLLCGPASVGSSNFCSHTSSLQTIEDTELPVGRCRDTQQQVDARRLLNRLAPTVAQCPTLGRTESPKMVSFVKFHNGAELMRPQARGSNNTKAKSQPLLTHALSERDKSHLKAPRFLMQSRQLCAHAMLKRARGRALAYSAKHCAPAVNEMNLNGWNEPWACTMPSSRSPSTMSASRRSWAAALTHSSGRGRSSSCRSHSCMDRQVLVGPHASRLRVPRADSVASLQRPQSVPAWPQQPKRSSELLVRKTLSGSSFDSGWHAQKPRRAHSAVQGTCQSNAGLPPWSATRNALHTGHRKQRLQHVSIGCQYLVAGKHANLSRPRLARPWQSFYASEQQLKRLCKRQMGIKSLPPDAASEWNLCLNMLEWEVDRDCATNPINAHNTTENVT